MANSFLRRDTPMEMRGVAAAAGRGSAIGYPGDENKSPREQHKKVHKTVKQRMKKSGKSSKSPQKKLPRKGLGVAQLERLRLQEHWKKMIKINHAHQPPLCFQVHQHRFPFPFADHHSGVYTSQIQTQAHLLHPYGLANVDFSGTAGTSYGNRIVFPNQLQMDQMRTANQEPRFYSGNLHKMCETSKELSSTQKMHWSSDQCDICKKKHVHGGKYPEILENIHVGDRRDNVSCNWEQCRYISLNPAPFLLSDDDVHEEVDVLAYDHREEKSVGANVLMEYDLFPQKVDPSVTCNSNSSNSSSTTTKTGGCPSYSNFSLAGVFAAGVASEASLTAHHTNSLDLSLKLSY